MIFVVILVVGMVICFVWPKWGVLVELFVLLFIVVFFMVFEDVWVEYIDFIKEFVEFILLNLFFWEVFVNMFDFGVVFMDFNMLGDIIIGFEDL